MSTSVSDKAVVADDCVLGLNVVIDDDVKIGRGCEIGHGVVIAPGTVIGQDVSIEANSVVGRQPRSGKNSTRQVSPMPPLVVGDGVVIGASTVIYAGTVLEDDVMVADLATIREGCRIRKAAIIGRSVTVECNSDIGQRTKIQTASHVTGDMVIEEDVFFGPQVVTMNDKYMGTKGDYYMGPRVKKGAAIGSNATILPGVTVGEKSIVGAGSVVTKDVPDGETHVGLPARNIAFEPKK
jgi:acetyltransferase-like isoleucine patch superfamily enzyme